MADSWEQRKGKKRPAGLIVLTGLAIIIISFLICNNLETCTKKKNTIETGKQDPETKTQEEAGPNTGKKEEDSVKEDKGKDGSSGPVPSEQATMKTSDTARALFSVDMPGVVCELADKKGPSIRVSLKLYFKEKELKNEVLFKRDNINLMVKKVFVKKKLSGIVVDALRAELQEEINALLEQGRVVDIEFLDFKPVEE